MKSETMPNGKIQVSANLQLYFRRSTRTASTQLLSGHLARLVGTLQSTLRYVYELLEDKKKQNFRPLPFRMSCQNCSNHTCHARAVKTYKQRAKRRSKKSLKSASTYPPLSPFSTMPRQTFCSMWSLSTGRFQILLRVQ